MMHPKVFKVKYLRTASPYQVNEIAAWPLAEAARLCAEGICEPADEAPELVSAIKAYRPGKDQDWQRYLLQPNYFRFHK
jgi:hypothetical protein